MLLGDGQRVGAPVDLARAGKHDLHLRVVVAAGLEDRQLAAAVDLEIGGRIPHAVEVADLAGEAEDDGAILHEIVHRRLLPDVRDVDPHPIRDAVDVGQVRRSRELANRRAARRRRARRDAARGCCR